MPVNSFIADEHKNQNIVKNENILLLLVKSCPPVETFVNSDVNSTSVTFYGTTLQYKCNIGHKYKEDNSTIKYRRCNEDAQWIPRNFSGCESECLSAEYIVSSGASF